MILMRARIFGNGWPRLNVFHEVSLFGAKHRDRYHVPVTLL
jgi:hypothetical protein